MKLLRPFDIKFLVLSDHPQEGAHEYFDTYAAAVAYLTGVLIPEAQNQADVDGYPVWIKDVMVCSIIADVVDSPDGLRVEKRV